MFYMNELESKSNNEILFEIKQMEDNIISQYHIGVEIKI